MSANASYTFDVESSALVDAPESVVDQARDDLASSAISNAKGASVRLEELRSGLRGLDKQVVCSTLEDAVDGAWLLDSQLVGHAKQLLQTKVAEWEIERNNICKGRDRGGSG